MAAIDKREYLGIRKDATMTNDLLQNFRSNAGMGFVSRYKELSYVPGKSMKPCECCESPKHLSKLKLS